MHKIFLLIVFFITTPILAQETITRTEVLKIAQETKKKIDAIKGYQFLLVKKEFVDGRDTGYQYINVKVQTKPLQIYVKFLKPKKYAGREALYKDDNLIVRRGGTRTPSMILHLDPNGALAMMDNRYPITHMNPKTLSHELLKKIEHELSFDATEIKVYPNAKISGEPATLYRMTHTEKQEGMRCWLADVMICKTKGIPIYFRMVNFSKVQLEEYGMLKMELNPKFTTADFDENNPEYKLKGNNND